jgi:hypothetical protein
MAAACLFALIVILCLPSFISAEESESDRPYPIDVTEQTLNNPAELARLQKPGTILFEEGFEEPDALKRFYNLRESDRGAQQIVLDGSVAHSGKGSLQLHTIDEGGESSDAGVTHWLGEGADTVYYRRYIRFAEDYDQGDLNHVGGSLYAVAGDNPSAQMGRAGLRPAGDDRFGAGFEPWKDWGRNPAPGSMMLYTYWMDMKVSGDGEKYWGNNFMPDETRRIVPERGAWVCLEHALISNTPGEANGELAAWVDGKLYMHLKGFRWRSSPNVKPKRVTCGMYIHRSKKKNVLWYDDLAASTGYIGP